MKVTYYYKGAVLGEITHTNISNIVTPYFEPNEPLSRIFQRFNGQECDNWRVDKTNFTSATFDIYLSPEKPAKSIGCMAADNRKPVSALVSKFCLVDVEFSHKQDSIDSAGLKSGNTWKIQGHLTGELHKRRPCIVLSIEGDNLEVIPLSTVPGDDTHFRFELSGNTFNGCESSYSYDSSYAVTRLKQTISLYRAFPMRGRDGKYKLTCHGIKLNKGDKNKLLNGLTTQRGLDVIQEITEDRDKVQRELLELQSTLDEQKEVINELRKVLGQPAQDDLTILRSLLS
jgi:uncharacterized protein YifN (PemK superfamily)